MGKIFIIQQNFKKNSQGFMVPRFDTTQAETFGELRVILPHGMNALVDGDSIKERLKSNLKDYTDDDYILPVGSPTLIGWAIHYATVYNDGLVKTLQWNNRKNDYEIIVQVLD